MVGYKVAELEEILKVSKQAIYNRLNSDKFSNYVYKEKNIRYLNDEGLNKLKLEYGIVEKIESLEDIKIKEIQQDHKDFKTDNQYFKDRIEYLESENSKLLEIISGLNNTMQQQNNIALNQTELLLVEKKEVLKLRAGEYQQGQKGIKGFIKSWLNS